MIYQDASVSSSDSDDSYDSEEEAMRARVAQATRARRLQAQAEAEQDLLRAYRERLGGWQGGRPRDGGVPGWKSAQSWAEEAEQGSRAGQRLAGRHGEAQQPLKCLLKQHVERWECLSMDQDVPALTPRSVPWLPCSPSDYLQGLADVLVDEETENFPQHQKKPLRRAYARACLWWHPDKFKQRYADRFADAEDLAQVLVRVQATFQDINEAWATGLAADLV